MKNDGLSLVDVKKLSPAVHAWVSKAPPVSELKALLKSLQKDGQDSELLVDEEDHVWVHLQLFACLLHLGKKAKIRRIKKADGPGLALRERMGDDRPIEQVAKFVFALSKSDEVKMIELAKDGKKRYGKHLQTSVYIHDVLNWKGAYGQHQIADLIQLGEKVTDWSKLKGAKSAHEALLMFQNKKAKSPGDGTGRGSANAVALRGIKMATGTIGKLKVDQLIAVAKLVKELNQIITERQKKLK